MSKKKRIMAALSIFVLFYSFIVLGNYFLEDYSSKAQTKELIEEIEDKESLLNEEAEFPSSPNMEIPDETVSEPVMLQKYQELYEQNPHIIGWIKIEGTKVNYPVMQNPEDKEYYLNHDFNKNKNINGLPFLDARSDAEASDILLMHGHNMKSGLIFGELIRYKEEAYYQNHSVIQFDTLYEEAEYEIVAVIISRVYYSHEKAFRYYETDKVHTENDFNSYIQNIKALSLYETGITPLYGDKLIVLSTCEYSYENGRLAVVARKIDNN